MPPDRFFMFVPHRSGSMLSHKILSAIAKETGRSHFSPNGEPRVPLQMIWENPELLLPPGIYGPLRTAVTIPDVEGAKIVVSLRDPRDVLVSMFYSYCYSHPGDVEGGTGYRAEVAARGIDDFVLRMATSETFPLPRDPKDGAEVWAFAGNIRERHERLLELAARPNARLLRYEDMVSNFRVWLGALATQLGAVNPALITKLVKTYGKFSPRGVHAHRRHVEPGDHREKLKPQTVDRLNAVFQPYFARMRELEGTNLSSETRSGSLNWLKRKVNRLVQLGG